MLLVTTLNSATASGGGCITWFEKPWLLGRRRVVQAVEEEIVERECGRPLDVERPLPDGGTRCPCSGPTAARRWQQHERRIFAAVERQGHRLFVRGSPGRAGWSRSHSGHRPVTSTASATWPTLMRMSTRWREPMVTRTPSTAAGGAGQLGGTPVGPDANGEELVVAVGVGGLALREAGVHVQGVTVAPARSLPWIADGPEHTGCLELGQDGAPPAR